MIYVVLAIILPFVENLMWGLGLGSILVAAVFYLYSSGRLSNGWIFTVAIFSVFMDVCLHISVGTLLISMGLGLLLFYGISYLVPVKDTNAKLPVIFVSLFAVHIFIGVISRWQGVNSIGDVLSAILSGAFRFAIFDLIIYVFLNSFADRIGHDGARIRLN